MLATPLPLPADRPAHMTRVLEEPSFDPGRHLDLALPERTWTLEEFGYDAAARARTPSPVAITTPFRVLSEEGAAPPRAILRSLRSDHQLGSGRRLSVYLAGGVYRSRFLRDLVQSPVLIEHLSRIAGTELMPHPIPQLQAYVNYSPEDPTKSVDTWHVDSLGYDAVLMVSDPALLTGGRFEYFEGTFDEAKALVGADSGTRYETGQQLEMKLVEANPLTGALRFEVPGGDASKAREGRPRGKPAGRRDGNPGKDGAVKKGPRKDKAGKHQVGKRGRPGNIRHQGRKKK